MLIPLVQRLAGNDYFITVNLLQMDDPPPAGLESSEPAEPGSVPVNVHSGYIGIFMLGDLSTIITVFDQESYHHTECDIAASIFSKALELSNQPQGNVTSPYMSLGRRRRSTHGPMQTDCASPGANRGYRRDAIAGRPDLLPSEYGRSGDLFHEIELRLLRQNTKLRDFQADFLMHTILDKAVDKLGPIVKAYELRLNFMDDQLPTVKRQDRRRLLEECSRIRAHLRDHLITVRPLKAVLHRLSEDANITTDCKTYISDVQSHLEQAMEDMHELTQRCQTLIDDDDRRQDRRMNDTLYVLTIVTTVFVPAQFVTGMYGMNFVKADGRPSMPELTFEYGYAYFWALVLSMTLFVLAVFKFYLKFI